MNNICVYACILYSLKLLKQPNTKSNVFLTKYFNFNHGERIFDGGWEFYGIRTDEKHYEKTSISYRLIDMIMKLPSFQGLSQVGMDPEVCIKHACTINHI